MKATDKQEGGSHYADRAIQPVQYIHANEMDFMTGNIIKYATRWRYKGQALSDLRKVIHYAELLIEAEGLDDKCDVLKHEEAQPVEGSYNTCSFCECAEGRCVAEEVENGAYDFMTISSKNYETR